MNNFKDFRPAYNIPPFPVLDIIAEKGEATLNIITKSLKYGIKTTKYNALINTLKKLVEDKILIRKGKGGFPDPFKYSINKKHPSFDMLNAMCNGRFEELSDKLDSHK